MTRVEIHMKISQKMKSTQGIPMYLKILKATRRWGSKKIFNGLHQPEDKKEQIIDYWKTERWWCTVTWGIFSSITRQPRRMVSIRTNLRLGS
jgi:hypothetical protein